jgi:hypothetical protein
MKIDYDSIVKEMVDDEATKSYTCINYNGKWYSIEINVKQEDKNMTKSELNKKSIIYEFWGGTKSGDPIFTTDELKHINNLLELFADKIEQHYKEKVSDDLKKEDELLLDVLQQSCGFYDIIDNYCVSSYEEACVYLEKRGYLKKRDNRVYEILKR